MLFQKREQDLLQQLMLPLPQRTMALITQLKADHEALLHSQLALLQQHMAAAEPTAQLPAPAAVKGEKLELVPAATSTQPMFVIENTESAQAGIGGSLSAVAQASIVMAAEEGLAEKTVNTEGGTGGAEGAEAGTMVNHTADCSMDAAQQDSSVQREDREGVKNHGDMELHIGGSGQHGSLSIRLCDRSEEDDNLNSLEGHSQEGDHGLKRKAQDIEDFREKRQREDT